MVSAGPSEFWTSVFHTRIPLLDQPACYGVNNTSNAWKDLDDEISAVDNVVSLVKARRNALAAPIVCLPVEVLSRIFSFVAATSEPMEDRWDEGRVDIGWIQVTRVCQRWRQIALANPFLWASIPFSEISPRLGEEMIRRSSNVALSLTFEVRRDWVVPACAKNSLIPPVVSRVRSLNIKNLEGGGHILGETRNTPALIESLGSHIASARALESLSLWSSYGAPVYLPFTIFSAGPPRLQSLFLNNCALPWQMNCLKSLVHLQVEMSEISPDMRDSVYFPTPTMMVDLLRQMPQLETLTLVGIFFDPEDSIQDINHVSRLPSGRWKPDTIVLSSLSSLRLIDISSKWIAFATSFVVPVTSHKIFELSSQFLYIPLHPLFANFAGPSNPPRSLVLNAKRDDYTCLRLSQDRLPLCEYDFELSIATKHMNSLFSLRAPSSWNGLHLGELTDLLVVDAMPGDWPRSQWLESFGDAKKVSVAVAHGSAAVLGLAVALIPLAEQPEVILFPALDTLRLQDVDLNDEVPAFDENPELPDNEMILNDLRIYDAVEACVATRHEWGYPIRELHIPRTHRMEEWVGALQKFVSEIYFDEPRSVRNPFELIHAPVPGWADLESPY
ncbi:hypothetical protein BV25DRAFT_226722 [Artomyces pyxidatus]|uniref:Uncharacterized protein n=1 Tax=Artomyces pyxidatus TaxID=48021 RepID=A0ACB8SHB1_9AGAM|nr:hypothetical protein BV25DRAFT_226722 [Artomyces pyxidatus]